jgi:Zn-dependent protease
VLSLLFNGHGLLFAILLLAIVLSLSLHEFGHAGVATALGDDTPRRAGRLTLNPLSHVDPMGLLLVVLVGFGYARPVPFSPARLRARWAPAAVAAAGPMMNLLLAAAAVNLLVWAGAPGGPALAPEAALALRILAQINVLLMLFNLLPLGPLDGHYVLSWLLPPALGRRYDQLNQRYGAQAFLVLVLLAVLGVPVFRFLAGLADALLPLLVMV